jgi:phytoene dehydrogenase-like protein
VEGTDAVVVGAGQNGLVAANMLADRGWDVLVLEAEDTPGGAVRSAEVTAPGFVSDLYSAFHPLAAVSPWMRALELEHHGLEWARMPAAVAHVHGDGRCALLSNDIEETCASLERFAPGDGDRWREVIGDWERAGGPFLDALFTPFPPIAAGARLARALGGDLLRFARWGVVPVRRIAEERFRGEGGGWLLAGNALHADLTPDMAGSALFGLVLCGVGQQLGFPFPRGGAGRLTDALVSRLESAGGELRCGHLVEAVEVRDGRATGVRCADGTTVEAKRAVLADVSAPALYEQLLAPEHVPAGLRRDLERFQWDSSTVKVEWALDGPIPWTAPDASRAGTIHVADGMDELTASSGELVRNLIPANPFLIVGQYAAADPTRAPAGCECAWAYTHVPQKVEGDAGGELSGDWEGGDGDRFADRIEQRIERVAPGFRELIRARYVQTPLTLERANRNLVGGAINGGTAQIHQQLVFRPTPGLGRPETPVRHLYLASSSAHPGGGVHGGPGANAAQAAAGASAITGSLVHAVGAASARAARLLRRRRVEY